ncbi:hypothetical protein, partial [Lentzea sp.]|uniref:hypothetical protein n=1 Tax=Lentzea sp. TaxID=56099 RepID=UPI002EF21B0C
PDARWLLGALTGRQTGADPVGLHRGTPIGHHVSFRVLPDIRFERSATGRTVAGRLTQPPEIFWLDVDASWVLAFLGDGESASFASVLKAAVGEWGVQSTSAAHRLTVAFHFLMAASIVEPAS